MGIANSVSMAFSEEDPSVKKREESEDSNETKEEIEDSSETKEKEEEEEIGECPLCTYIKGGECKESFVALQKCVDEEEEDEEEEATKCKEVRKIFKTCMFDNPVYYEPLIRAQAHEVARMISELQAEKEAVLAGDAAAIANALSMLQPEEEPVLPAEVAAIAKAFQELEAEKEEIAKGNE